MKSLVDQVTGAFKYLTVAEKEKPSNKYEVMLNPESYSMDFQINYDLDPSISASGSTPNYRNSQPATCKFDLLFDGTGVIDLTRTDVQTEIETFKGIVYDYDGKKHSPKILQITWGAGMSFDCRLQSMTMNYNLFGPDGKPLRAKVSVTFVNYVSPKDLDKQEKPSSPDMTHQITVKSGDNLPQLCEQIYGEAKYFVQVARHNGLYDFRALKSGTTLTFPPLN